MSGDKEILFWESNPKWFRIGPDGEYELTDEAPERAKKSFELARKPRKEKKNPFI